VFGGCDHAAMWRVTYSFSAVR